MKIICRPITNQSTSDLNYEQFLDRLTPEESARELKVPTGDASTVKRWAELLYETAITRPEMSATVIKLCQRTVQENSTTFTMKDLSKLFYAKILAEFEKFRPHRDSTPPFRETSSQTFLLSLVKSQLVSNALVIKIWKILSDRIHPDSKTDLLMLVEWINEAQTCFEHAEGQHSPAFISVVVKKLTNHLNSGTQSKDLQSDIQKAIKYLTSLNKRQETPKREAKKLPPSPLDDLASYLQSQESNPCEMFAVMRNVETSEKEMRNLAKIFYDNAGKRKDIGDLANLIDFQTRQQTESSTFQKIISSMVQNAFKKLPKFDQITADDEVEHAIFLVRITADFYNIGWTEESKLISCMDKLAANDFASENQVEIFFLLLTVASEKMMKNKFVGKCRYYIDIMRTIESETRKKCIKILEKIVEVAKREADGDSEMFQSADVEEVLSNITEENINETAKEISEMYLRKQGTDEAADLLTKFLAKALENPKLFARILKSANRILFTFAVLERCQIEFFGLFKAGKQEPKISQLIGEFYKEKLADYHYIKIVIDNLLGYEQTCHLSADCISVLIRTACVRLEAEEDLECLFEYFNFEVKSRNESYSSSVLKHLTDLGKNKWKYDEVMIESFVDYNLKYLTDDRISSCCFNIKLMLEDFQQTSAIFINKIWEFVILKPETVQSIGKLLKEFSKTEFTLIVDLLTFLEARNRSFLSIPVEQYTEVMKRRLANVVNFASELFLLDIAQESFIEMWLPEKIINLVPLTDAASISSRLSSKLQETGSIQLMMQLMFLDDKVSLDMDNEKKMLQDEIAKLTKKT